jgi:8-oxo-dGTP pyrophosphatase MutT (NUDIX family)
LPDTVIAAAWVLVRDRRVLVVRAYDSDAFYLPGGKPEPGESFAEAAAREVREEVGMVVDPAALTAFADFIAPAHNRPPGTRVRLICFSGGDPGGDPKPASEIAELAWFAQSDAQRTAPAIRLVLAQLLSEGKID